VISGTECSHAGVDQHQSHPRLNAVMVEAPQLVIQIS
jgi:hypothetical protein